MSNYLVTTALNYANGELHLGHLLELIQADIWVRTKHMLGNNCKFVSGADAHGTPIMLKAMATDQTPQELTKQFAKLHHRVIKDFLIELDNYSTTNTETNQKIVNHIYTMVSDNNHLTTKTIEQYYDTVTNMFLPDRLLRGTCPKCQAQDQYGDNCEACGATYSTFELLEPRSSLNGSTPILKKTEHIFFKLSDFESWLTTWTQSGVLPQSLTNKFKEWFSDGLKDWDISRDKPYLGFPIPDHPDQFFYVWFDAPIGYIAATKELIAEDNSNNQEIIPTEWLPESDCEIHHFIGKDIAYFHGLFWPAVLHSANLKTPAKINCHGFLTLNHKKMSKSRGNFVTAAEYLTTLNPEYLRYFLAAKLNDGIDDLDLTWDDFVSKINSDLIGKLVNIPSRTVGLLRKNNANLLGSKLADPAMYHDFVQAGMHIIELYQNRQYHLAMREIMLYTDRANQFIAENQPWNLAKQGDIAEMTAVITQALNLYRLLILYLSPVLPRTWALSQEFMRDNLTWTNRDTPLLNHEIGEYKHLLSRIDISACPQNHE